MWRKSFHFYLIFLKAAFQKWIKVKDVPNPHLEGTWYVFLIAFHKLSRLQSLQWDNSTTANPKILVFIFSKNPFRRSLGHPNNIARHFEFAVCIARIGIHNSVPKSLGYLKGLPNHLTSADHLVNSWQGVGGRTLVLEAKEPGYSPTLCLHVWPLVLHLTYHLQDGESHLWPAPLMGQLWRWYGNMGSNHGTHW